MPPKRSTPRVYARARQFRKEPTPAEAKLWAYLRGNKLNEVNFRRQHAIGHYIVDFCSVKRKLVIELDGGQHLKSEEYDLERTVFLRAQGYTVLRFWNDKVMNDMGGVMKAIDLTLEK
jgi:very-short-patch-repair endonuclease